jgi:type I restriction enzyme, S subunit
MKAEWQRKQLGEVCDVVNGGTPKTGVPEYWGGNHLWITPAEMGKRLSPYVSDTERKITDLGLRDSSARLLPPNSVILSSRAPIGHLVINTEPMATNQGCKGLVPCSQLNDKFLYYYLSSIVDLLNSLGTGATFKELSGGKLKEVTIPLPPLPEQPRIVGILDEAFDGIATAKANAEQNRQNARALFESHLQSVFTQRGDGREEVELSSLCQRLHQGLNTAGEKVKFYDSGYPIIQTRNITAGEIDLTEKMKFLCEDDWLIYKDKFRPQVGDVFFTNIGTIGKTAIVKNDDDYLIHWNIFKLRPAFERITPAFLKYTLDHLTSSGYFSEMQKGGTVEFVTKKMISEAIISLPSIAEQIRTVEMLDALRAETQRFESIYQQKLAALDELKKSLLHQAFTGQL